MLKRRGTKDPWSRVVRLTSCFNRGEAADLMLIATKWGVAPAIVIWAVIAEWLALKRGRDVMDLPYGHSTREILRKARALEQEYAFEREESEGGGGPVAADVCPVCGHEYVLAAEAGEGPGDGDDRGAAEHGDEPGSVGGGPVPGPRAGTEASSKV